MLSTGFYPLPAWSPLYEPAPHRFKRCRSVSLLCRAPDGALADLVAYPLKPSLDRGEYFRVAFMEADEVQFSSHTARKQLVVEFVVPVSYGGIHGGHCALEYLASDLGLAAGRELWGWPKKMAQLSWVEHDRGVHAEVQRDGFTLIMLDFEPDEHVAARPWPHVVGFEEGAPYLQVRPNGASGEGHLARLDVIREDADPTAVHSSSSGTGRLRLFAGPLDPLSFLGPIEVVGARFDVYDFDFDWGTVIASVGLPDAADYAQRCTELSYRLRADAGFAPIHSGRR